MCSFCVTYRKTMSGQTLQRPSPQASLFSMIWHMLGRHGKSFSKGLSLTVKEKKKKRLKFSIIPFPVFHPSQTPIYCVLPSLKPSSVLREVGLHLPHTSRAEAQASCCRFRTLCKNSNICHIQQVPRARHSHSSRLLIFIM